LFNLVRLRLASDFLEIHKLAYALASEDVMTPAHSRKMKPEGPGQSASLIEAKIGRRRKGFLEQFARVHAPLLSVQPRLIPIWN
jgi:hypothetical protein